MCEKRLSTTNSLELHLSTIKEDANEQNSSASENSAHDEGADDRGLFLNRAHHEVIELIQTNEERRTANPQPKRSSNDVFQLEQVSNLTIDKYGLTS